MERLEARRLLAAGDLDTSFGNGGRIEDEIPSLGAVTDAIVMDDGKVLVSGGTVDLLIAERRQYMLRRYTADGALDPTFSGDGVVLGNFTSQEDEDSGIFDIALQSDGKIIALGEASGVALGGRQLARFNTDGSLDTSFGDSGVVHVQLSTANFLDIRSDDRIIIASDLDVQRFLPDGTLDTDFGDDGQAESAVNDLRTMKVQPDGKILLGGDIGGFMIQRLNADGSVDTGFGDNGIIDADPLPGTTITVLNDIELLPGGQFLAVGKASDFGTPGNGVYHVVRYNADGTVDQTYASGGLTIPFTEHLLVSDAVIDDDGNAVLIGDNPGMQIARATAGGEFDEQFGRVVMWYPDNAVFAVAGGVQPNGNILVIGQRNIQDAQGDYHSFVTMHSLLSDDTGPASPISLDAGELLIPGTSGDDIVKVTEENELVFTNLNGFGRGFETGDVDLVSIIAGGGDDHIDLRFLQTESAHVSGGTGSDKIVGGQSSDTIEGNGGRDFIDGGLSKDVVSGGAGNDQIRGQGGADHLYGGGGNDFVMGNGGNDRIDGGDGADTLVGGAGNDIFLASDGVIDLLFGNDANDSATADDDDVLSGIETTI